MLTGVVSFAAGSRDYCIVYQIERKEMTVAHYVRMGEAYIDFRSWMRDNKQDEKNQNRGDQP